MNCSFTDKQYWIDFIELYRNYDCLWKIKSIEYIDRHKKKAAYEILAEKLKELDSEANVSP